MKFACWCWKMPMSNTHSLSDTYRFNIQTAEKCRYSVLQIFKSQGKKTILNLVLLPGLWNVWEVGIEPGRSSNSQNIANCPNAAQMPPAFLAFLYLTTCHHCSLYILDKKWLTGINQGSMRPVLPLIPCSELRDWSLMSIGILLMVAKMLRARIWTRNHVLTH